MFANVCIPLYAYRLTNCICTYFAEQFLCCIIYILSLLTKRLIDVKDIKINWIGVIDKNKSFINFWVTKLFFVIMAIIYE